MLPQAITNFHDNLARIRRADYNETEVRVQFINPLFEALGWDMRDASGRHEVRHEDRIHISGKAKAPDYGFYLDGRRKFFVEAKKPAVNLDKHTDPAYQLRRYAWTARLPLSVLTDFEEFAVYDTRVRPVVGDSPRVARLRYCRGRLDYERYGVLAVSSIYGIDILEDNVIACRGRLLAIFDEAYRAAFKSQARDECVAAAAFILSRNIIHGDALTLKSVGENPQPIIFSEWALATGNLMKRRDFTFEELLARAENKELALFAEGNREAFIPMPVREFPLVHFLRVMNVSDE